MPKLVKAAKGVGKAGKASHSAAHITYTDGMKRTFQEKLLNNGRDAVVKSRRNLEKRLQEYIVKARKNT
ncbi:MAG: hypothetical protein ACX93T_02300 [Bacteroidota bacterium]